MAAPPASAQEGLPARAEAARDAARAHLAQAREARVEARSELTRAYQRAQVELQRARTELTRVQAELEAAERSAARAERTIATTERGRRELRRLLGQAGALPPTGRELEVPTMLAAVEAGVDARLAGLDHDAHVHESRVQVLGRDGRSREARVLRLGTVLTLADGDVPEATGFVSESPGRPPQVVGRPLDPEMQAMLRAAEPGRAGRLPLDLDGALTRLDAEPPEGTGGLLAAGGIFVWPILAVGLLGLLLVVERLLYFVLRPVRPGRIAQVVGALQRGELEAASALVTPAASDLDRVLAAGVEAHPRPRPEREQVLENALLREEPRLERGLALLGAVAGLAPLLGLLGTVTGMIATFDVISTFGTGNPRLLSGGISVALITTQLGLVVAVPALLAHAWVSRAVGRRQALLEEARTALLGLADPEVPR